VNFRDGENLLTANAVNGNLNLTDTTKVFYKSITVNSTEIAVNVGSNADFIDESKIVWIADQPYKPGSFGYVGKNQPNAYGSQNDKNIIGTNDDPLFQTMQENINAYRFDIPAGVYEVELKFAETKFDKTGQRVFDVKINGELMLEKLDLVKEVGSQTALTKRFKINAMNGIVIEFAAIQGTPILSGIRLRRL